MATKTELAPITVVGTTRREYGVGAITSLRTDGSIKLTRKKYGEPVHSEPVDSASIANPSARQAANQLRAVTKGVINSLKGHLNKSQAAEWCLTAVVVLLLALATDLQHSASLARDLRSAKSQLLYCDSQRDFHAGQPTSTARGLMLNHTVDEASLHPVLQLILPPEQLPPARSPAPKRGTPQEMSTRLFAALLAVGCIAGCWIGYKKMDDLPQPAQVFLHAMMRRNQQGVPAIASTIPLSKHIAYKLDTWFSKNEWSKVVALLGLALVLIYLGGLGLYSVSGRTLGDAFWEAVAGAGFDWKFSEDAVFGGFMMRFMSLAVSLGGMLITALLLGIVSDTIGEWMEDLRKGKADVLETGHSLILGWSDKLLPIVDQLCNANASEGGRPIVILAEMEKQAMEEALAKHAPNLRGSTIICRCGNPLLSADLAKVSCAEARSIIVLATAGAPQQSDARVLRITLSLLGLNDRLHNEGLPGLQGHIVVEVCDMDNEPLVRMVGGSAVETVVSHDIIGRLMIQCARQPGLATVWEQLMGFDGGCSHDGLQGDEFYIKEWPEVEGYTFREVLVSFPKATPIGVEEKATLNVLLNPQDDYLIQPGDKIIVLAEDDDTYQPAEPAELEIQMSYPDWKPKKRIERILFLGWRRDMHDIISVLDRFVDQGSELWLYNEVPWEKREELLIKGGLDPKKDLLNLTLRYDEPSLQGDPVDRHSLEVLRPESFSSVLILADDTEYWSLKATDMRKLANIADADSRCLASLLLLRDIQSSRMHFAKNARQSVLMPAAQTTQRNWFDSSTNQSVSKKEDTSWSENLMGAVQRTVIISEILDSRTRHLIQGLRLSEFVMSNELVSMTLAMVSESREVNTILKELFTPEGNELYVHPASRYLRVGENLNFFEMMIRGRTKREIVIGYKNFDMVKPAVNPKDKVARILNVDDTAAFVVLGLGMPS